MFIMGLCLLAFGLPMTISMFRNLYLISEHPYSYRLSEGMTEETLITLAIVFTVVTIVGIVLMLAGWVKRRNKAALDSIVNASKRNYCRYCNINVTEGSCCCPLCGRPL